MTTTTTTQAENYNATMNAFARHPLVRINTFAIDMAVEAVTLPLALVTVPFTTKYIRLWGRLFVGSFQYLSRK